MRMKKFFASVLAIVSVFAFASNVKAVDVTNMTCEEGKKVCYGLPQTKYYDGSEISFNTTLVDYYDHDKVLVEGLDYDKVYVTTRDKGFNDPGDAFENPEKYSDNDFVTPGWVIEIIELKGEYLGRIDIYNNIAHLIYVYGDTTSKDKGENDPELNGVYYYRKGNGWTSTDEATIDGYKYDISKYVTINREEGEEVGTYVTTPEVNFPEEYTHVKFNDSQYYLVDTVPAYLFIVNGVLTINETEANYDVKYIDEETGNEIKETETRVGRIGKKVEVTEDDFKIDGYEYDAESKDNILSVDKLTADGATLVINFKKITDNIEGQGGDEEPTNLVQTGSEVDYSLMTSALITISLMAIALKTKKKNN